MAQRALETAAEKPTRPMPIPVRTAVLANVESITLALPGHAPAPGSQGRRADPASLAAVLVGRWLSPLLTIDIRADGTATVTGPLADSGAYRGTWSVGADGRLRTDVMGTPMIADAVVSASGDELTLVVGGHPVLGQPFRLRRSMAG